MDIRWSLHEISDSVEPDSILFFLKHWDVWFSWWSRHMQFMHLMKVWDSFVPAKLNCEMSSGHSLGQFSHRHFVLPQIAVQITRFMDKKNGATWVLSAPGGPHVGPMNPAIMDPFWMQSEAPDIIDVMWYNVCNHCVWPNLVGMQQWWL